jgi:hypothetical protein
MLSHTLRRMIIAAAPISLFRSPTSHNQDAHQFIGAFWVYIRRHFLCSDLSRNVRTHSEDNHSGFRFKKLALLTLSVYRLSELF